MPELLVKLKRLHPAQELILNERKRFNVIKCGRRFGKTELGQELISESALDAKTVAYFSPTYKDLYEVWMACKNIFHDIIRTKDEQVKQLRFITGGKADFWSMEDPDSGRGRSYHRVIIDECEKAGKFKEAWEQTIRATLADNSGDGYFLSTPQIGSTYFKEIALFEKKYPDWKTFIFSTDANPYIDKNEIEQARLLLPDAIFRSEFLAEDVVGGAANPFCHQYNPVEHESVNAVFKEGKQLYISVDFNLNPFGVIFFHLWQDERGLWFTVFDEDEVQNGSVPAMISLIKMKYENQLPNCFLTGDATGLHGDLSQVDQANYFEQLRRGLNMRQSQIVLSANPTHENSRADVNYLLYHSKQDTHSFFHTMINPLCKGLVRDLMTVQCDAYGKIIKKDRKDISQHSDLLDCFRYGCQNFLRKYILNHQKKKV